MQAFYGIVFYLGKTIWPTNLVPLYEQSPQATPWEGAYIGSAILVLGITIVVGSLRRRWPGLFVAWAVYVVLLSPMLGLAQAGPQLVADRPHQIPVSLARIDLHPQHPVRPRRHHRHQARSHAMPALTLLDIDDSVAGVDGRDDSAKGL
jgi:hypothetical protein